MDAVKFLKTAYRMCCTYKNCDGCPGKANSCFISYVKNENLESVVASVEQWEKDHPVKTRQSEFLKMFPNAQMSADGDVIWMCPKYISYDYRPEENCHEISCDDCKRKFWLAEVSE